MSVTTATAPSQSSLVATLDRLSVLSYPLIRVTAGLLLMPHGAQKLFGLFGGYGLAATGEFFGAKLGLQPGILFAGLAGFIEFFGGLALVLGLLTRPAAVGVLTLMAVAVFSVHLPSGFFWTAGGYEYPLMWGLLAVAIVLKGGGRYSLDRKLGLPL
ncbi:DoxX family protein [Skermanella stibiiresistens]|nr:DoxX family protein [Skermanella stibiiresistens]